MASCEKCWADSRSDPEEYNRLVSTRNCTPEEQAGEYADFCPFCERYTVHQYVHICMNAECLFDRLLTGGNDDR